MSEPKIEEITDAAPSPAVAGAMEKAEEEIIQHFSEWDKRRYVPKPGEPDLPPQISQFANKSADEVMKELNRLPFFMTELDETDGEGGENLGVEALKSLAYDGEPDEIATNFKNQGNEAFKQKQYKTAITFYTKGIEVDCGVDAISAALHLNRAACHLEVKNYRSCIEDCKKVLLLDEKSVKACYRSGRAFFAIAKYEEARGILQYGLTLDPENKPIQETLVKVEAKEKALAEAAAKREREEKEKEMKQTILVNAIKLRHFTLVKTARPAELLEDAKIHLEDPLDHESQLIFPAMVVYPTLDEFDYVAEISELTTPIELLEIVLNRPRDWFEQKEERRDFATIKKLECYMETEQGGLVKLGKKVAVNQVLMADKPDVPLFDNSLRIYVVPKEQSATWLGTWNKKAALEKRK
ncbi:hsp70/Hsp90 co-chaperone Cns1p [[Candida] anglica]|uniref:Hsp70/Hsp90 co-chaperone Cns1p n=1 Tax=[Candida] anglica TaxID=148631 RepID=A0ABP0E5Z2_9ASCO